MTHRDSEYAGQRSNVNRRKKYAGCEYRRNSSGSVRLLTDIEIEEFRAHIERRLNPSLRVKPAYRRSIV